MLLVGRNAALKSLRPDLAAMRFGHSPERPWREGGSEPATEGSLGQKRSVVIGKQKTSLTVEDEFWLLLKEIAAHEKLPVRQLVARIDTNRLHAGNAPVT